MSTGVVDASIAVAWCFDDENSPATDALLTRVRKSGAAAPAVWPLEIANVLVLAVKKGRMTASDMKARLDLIAELPIDIDRDPSGRAWREIPALARAENLTAYDAAYLELAMRRRLPLMSSDKDLRAAAKRLGVAVLP